MSLATRCTSCGTVFRVVQDQLKVSEGWVRCGRCDAVFNALEGLFDLGRDTPPEWTGDPAPVLSARRAGHGSSRGSRPRRRDRFRSGRLPRPPRRRTAAPGDEKGHSSSFPSTAPAAFQDLLADPIDAHLFRKRGPVVRRQGRRTRPARVLRRPLRLRPVRRELRRRRYRCRDVDERRRRPAARERPRTARLPAPRRKEGPLAQRPGASRARRRERARDPAAAAAGRATSSATPSPPAGPAPGPCWPAGADWPTARSRRRAGSTR